ncbi:hypothetical protein MASR1M65_30210 [Saprospiraceae bacterium]
MYQGIIFKSDSSGRILRYRDINPYLKIGLPYKERYTEDSNPCWMSYDSSLHHIKMIDTFLNHKISKAEVSTATIIHIFERYVIISNSIGIYQGDWSKSLHHSGKILDKNGVTVWQSENMPDNRINLWDTVIDTSGKYLATIRSDHFEEWEGGHLNPLDFFLDVYSFPDMKLIFSEEIPKYFHLKVHDGIFWVQFNEIVDSGSNIPIGIHHLFYDLEKNKCYELYLPDMFFFDGCCDEKAWLKDGILIQTSSSGTTVAKNFDRDFKVKELIRK